MYPGVIDSQGLIDLQILIVIALCLLFSLHIAKILRLLISVIEIILDALTVYFGFMGKSENFTILANVGFYYLMFIVDMEVNLRTSLNMDKEIVKKSFFYIMLFYSFSSAMVWVFEFSFVSVLIIPVMNVGLLSLLYKSFGRECYQLNTATIVATLTEVILIVFLTIAGAFLREGTSIIDVVQNILYLNIFLGPCSLGFEVLGVFFWWYPQLKVALMSWGDKNEKDVRFRMAIFVLIIVVMIITKLEIVLGSFITGFLIATFFDYKKDLEHKLSSFGHDSLIPIFFIHTGAISDLKMTLGYEIVLDAILLVFVMVGLRILCASVFWKRIGFQNMVLFGLSHSMPLTLLIATAMLGYSGKVISEELYSVLVLTALFETIVVMSAVKLIPDTKK